jgi:hypothetical protein
MKMVSIWALSQRKKKSSGRRLGDPWLLAETRQMQCVLKSHLAM